MKLIPKDAVLAEIEKRINTCLNQREEMIIAGCETLAGDATARAGELQCLMDSIESLEVKEVDFGKSIDDYVNSHFSEGSDNCMISDANKSLGGVTYSDLSDIAKYFFELGLNASYPLTWEDIKTIDKLLNQCVDCGKPYQEVLKRFKSQKGE